MQTSSGIGKIIPSLALLIFGLYIGIASTVNAQTTFTRSLTIGSRGEDVRALQVELNKDPETRVAVTGPGSPGSETSYFGGLTRAAVTRFQNKYQAEVLFPVGLTQGTGYFGPSTRNFLNTLQTNTQTPVTVAPTIPDPLGTALLRVEPLAVRKGSYVAIHGTGFTQNSYIVAFQDGTTATARKTDTTILTMAIPQTATEGKQAIKLRSIFGTSLSNEVPLTILSSELSQDTLPPQIDSLTPTSGANGTIVTVTGQGFTANNIVYTGYDAQNISSTNGTTLQVTLNPGWVSSIETTATVPLWIYIENENGASDVEVFTFEL